MKKKYKILLLLIILLIAVLWDLLIVYAVTGYGGSEKPYSLGMNAYVMYPNRETVDYAKMLIDKVMSGEVLTDEDINKPI